MSKDNVARPEVAMRSVDELVAYTFWVKGGRHGPMPECAKGPAPPAVTTRPQTVAKERK